MRQEYSEDSRKVISNARGVSDRFNHDYISTTHILLGMLYYRVCDSIEMIEELNIDTKEIIENIEKILKPEINNKNDGGPIIFTKSTKKMMEVAVNEKRSLGMEYVEPSHMLLGILKDEDSEACHILNFFKLNYTKIKKMFEDPKYLEPETLFEDEFEEDNNHKSKLKPVPPRRPSFNDEDHINRRNKLGLNKKEKSTTPTLDTFGKDLTKLAKDGKLDKIIGRDKEIKRMVHVLSRRTKHNLILLGDSGTGKTAIVDGLAQKIINGDVPTKLKDKRVITLELGMMIAGTKFRGEFEKRLQSVIEEVKKEKNIIIFIDEIHTMIGAGSAEGSMDASNIMKPALSRGEIQCIGATTTEEYRKYFEDDNALNRRFQSIKVEQPSIKDTIQILSGIKKYYEEYHKVIYSDIILDKIVDLSQKYITNKQFPDKAIDVLDEVGAKVSLENDSNKNIIELKKRIKELNEKKQKSTESKKRKNVSKFKEQIIKLEQKLFTSITESDVRSVLGSITNIPIDKIHSNSDDAKRFLNMSDKLKKVIINQDDAINKISSVIKRSKSGIKDPKSPNVLLFVGSSGTGKTFTAKKLAEFLFGDEKKLTYIDCSELSTKYDVNKLIGSSAGFVGYDDASKFEKIRQNPYSVILLDECEKAHRDIWNIFLRIFEEGELEDSKGRYINFKHCLFIMTSNIGSSYFTHNKKIGFPTDDKTLELKDISIRIKEEISKHFKPEFLNRLDDTIIFNPLGKKELMLIVKNELSSLQERMIDRGITLDIKENAIKYIVEKADEESKGSMGARPLKRVIDKSIEGNLCDILLNEGDLINKITVSLDKHKELKFTTKKRRKK